MEQNILKGEKLERLVQSNLGELFNLVLKSFDEDAILQVDPVTGRTLKPRELLKKSISVAKYMKSKGINIGDCISINCENRLEFCIVLIASFLLGVTFHPLNPQYTEGEIQHVLKLSKPKIVFTSYENIEKLINILPQHPYVQELILFGSKGVNHPKTKLFDDIISNAIIEDFDSFVVPPYSLETVAVILCSSGTTGLPKGVMLTHDNLTAYLDVGRTFIESVFADDMMDDHFIGLVPFFHSFGFMTMMVNLLRGKSTIVLSKFIPRTFLSCLEKYKIRKLIVPPPLLVFLLKNPIVKEYNLSSLETILTGAAPLGKVVEDQLNKKFKLKHCGQGYGLTESTLSVALTPPDAPRSGSVGKVAPGLMVKIIDVEGKPLGPYQEGEICVKGPLVMKGYINDEAATRGCIDEDRWLHTGDVGYYDKDKYLYIVDRIKELIKYKAFQVAPAELEAILLTHPAIQDSGVVGLPDEDAGELPLAFVVKKAGARVTQKDIQDFIAGKVSPQKRLRGGVVFIDEIPRNPSGKILRRVLKQKLKNVKSKL